MTEAFEQAHKQRFGFIARERGLVVEALSVEAVGAAESIVDEPATCLLRCHSRRRRMR